MTTPHFEIVTGLLELRNTKTGERVELEFAGAPQPDLRIAPRDNGHHHSALVEFTDPAKPPTFEQVYDRYPGLAETGEMLRQVFAAGLNGRVMSSAAGSHDLWKWPHPPSSSSITTIWQKKSGGPGIFWDGTQQHWQLAATSNQEKLRVLRIVAEEMLAKLGATPSVG